MPRISEIWTIISEINLREPTWDIFIVLFFVLGALLYGFSMGKSRLVVNMVAIYTAMAVAMALERLTILTAYMPPHQLFLAQTGAFLVAFIGLYVLLSRKSPLERVVRSARKEKLLHIMVYAIAHVGLILAVILSFIPHTLDVQFSSLTKTIFMHDIAYVVWILLPILLMIVFPEKIRRYD